MGEEDGLVWIDDSMYNPKEGGMSPQEWEELDNDPRYIEARKKVHQKLKEKGLI